MLRTSEHCRHCGEAELLHTSKSRVKTRLTSAALAWPLYSARATDRNSTCWDINNCNITGRGAHQLRSLRSRSHRLCAALDSLQPRQTAGHPEAIAGLADTSASRSCQPQHEYRLHKPLIHRRTCAPLMLAMITCASNAQVMQLACCLHRAVQLHGRHDPNPQCSPQAPRRVSNAASSGTHVREPVMMQTQPARCVDS